MYVIMKSAYISLYMLQTCYNAYWYQNGDTPLHIASDRGALDVVRVLLQHKAYPHTQNKVAKLFILGTN